MQESWPEDLSLSRQGMMIVAVPSNDFGGQDPGDEAEIERTARQYAMSLPIADKGVGDGDTPTLEFSQIP